MSYIYHIYKRRIIDLEDELLLESRYKINVYTLIFEPTKIPKLNLSMYDLYDIADSLQIHLI